MPKRLLFFLLALAFMVFMTIMGPLSEKLQAENSSLNTSVSSNPLGFKGLYLLMSRLDGKPVALLNHSIMWLKGRKPRTIWFFEPGKGLYHDGKTYSDKMRALVKEGSHLVFVLNEQRFRRNQKESLKDEFEAINEWFDLDLDTSYSEDQKRLLLVDSYFKSRTIEALNFDDYAFEKSLETLSSNAKYEAENLETHVFDDDSIGNAEVLLENEEGDPLVVTYKQGEGRLTFMLNSYFLNNSQLPKGENAALAFALQELHPTDETLFEIYSTGFRDNKDVLTYLATGKGLSFLISAMLLFTFFMVWLIQKPVGKVYFLETSDERYFTQEAFISALADHYLNTQDWRGLYQKMLDQFTLELSSLYSGLELEDKLQTIADNPFYEVDIDSLRGLYDVSKIRTEADYLVQSNRLIEIKRKVIRHEHTTTNYSRKTAH